MSDNNFFAKYLAMGFSQEELDERFANVNKSTAQKVKDSSPTSVQDAQKAFDKAVKERDSWSTELSQLQELYDSVHSNRNIDLYQRLEREQTLKQKIDAAKKEYQAADRLCSKSRGNLARVTRKAEDDTRKEEERLKSENAIIERLRRAYQGSKESFDAALPALLQKYYEQQALQSVGDIQNPRQATEEAIRHKINTFVPEN